MFSIGCFKEFPIYRYLKFITLVLNIIICVHKNMRPSTCNEPPTCLSSTFAIRRITQNKEMKLCFFLVRSLITKT